MSLNGFLRAFCLVIYSSRRNRKRGMPGYHTNVTPPKREADCTSCQEGVGAERSHRDLSPKPKVVLLKMVQFRAI